MRFRTIEIGQWRTAELDARFAIAAYPSEAREALILALEGLTSGAGSELHRCLDALVPGATWAAPLVCHERGYHAALALTRASGESLRAELRSLDEEISRLFDGLRAVDEELDSSGRPSPGAPAAATATATAASQRPASAVIGATTAALAEAEAKQKRLTALLASKQVTAFREEIPYSVARELLDLLAGDPKHVVALRSAMTMSGSLSTRLAAAPEARELADRLVVARQGLNAALDAALPALHRLPIDALDAARARVVELNERHEHLIGLLGARSESGFLDFNRVACARVRADAALEQDIVEFWAAEVDRLQSDDAAVGDRRVAFESELAAARHFVGMTDASVDEVLEALRSAPALVRLPGAVRDALGALSSSLDAEVMALQARAGAFEDDVPEDRPEAAAPEALADASVADGPVADGAIADVRVRHGEASAALDRAMQRRRDLAERERANERELRLLEARSATSLWSQPGTALGTVGRMIVDEVRRAMAAGDGTSTTAPIVVVDPTLAVSPREAFGLLSALDELATTQLIVLTDDPVALALAGASLETATG